MIRFAPPTLRFRPISLGLLGLSGAIALAAGLWPLDVTAPAAPSNAPALDLARLATLDTGAALARPLFDPERRDWTARGSRDDLLAEAQPPTLLSVRGILIEDRVRRALVADGATAPTWLSPGEGRGAWRLVSIEAGHVVVADADRRYTLTFLGAPVALRPAPRHPKLEVPVPHATPEPSEAPVTIRRIPITMPGGR